MFEIGWTELLLVGILAIVLFRPSDLPDIMRSLGRFAAKAKRTIFDMQEQFKTAMHEADLQDVHRAIEDVSDLRSFSPRKQISKVLGEMKTEIERGVKPDGE
jgi:sec-independent protein translocase protein TatB